MNEAAEATRSRLISETWPRSVTVRRSNFLQWALTREYARKDRLRVAITDTKAQGRGSLKLHAEGGTKQPKGSALTIPNPTYIRRTGQGVPRGLRAKNLANSFRKGDAIYQRVKGKGGATKLRLMYVLKPRLVQKPDVPFIRDFRATMLLELEKRFPIAMARAMETRRA